MSVSEENVVQVLSFMGTGREREKEGEGELSPEGWGFESLAHCEYTVKWDLIFKAVPLSSNMSLQHTHMSHHRFTIIGDV